jgi:hypothetical protein
MLQIESKRLSDKLLLGRMLASQARLKLQLKQLQEAVQMLEGAIAIFKELGNAGRAVDASLLLIGINIRQGRLLQAGKRIISILKIARSSDLLYPRTILSWLRIPFMR